MVNCNTVREAYEKFFRYQEVTSQGLQFHLSEDESTASIGLRLFHSTEKMIRHHAEYILSGIHTMIPQLCGRMVDVVEVRFTHQAPDNISEYQKIFRAPILFGAPELSITYDRTYLELPMTAPNPTLLSVLEKHAAEVLKGIQPANTTSDRVRRMLAQGFQGNAPRIDEIAKKMAVSTRKLQLLLQEEGTSYLSIFEDVRKKLAITYLEENRFSVDEITYLLGFSEPSVFYRTFKRWTGQTPRAYRSR
jgi:AraC-like DNA-binding protein